MTSFTQPPASPSSIPLYLINGVATVWDAQIAATLHCEHGISGLRVGTLPGVSQQNAFLGLPMTLMKEETAYLVTQGIAHLVPVRRELALPDARMLEEYNDARLARIRAQELRNRQAAENKAIVGKEAFQKGGDAARVKREARAKAKAEKERAQREAEGTLFGEEVPQQSIPVTATPQTETTPIEGSGGHFHTVQAMPTFPELSFAESITNLPHPLFPFPNTPRDQALLTTFKTLADNGLRMGLGPRFGGEYLVYPGDYLRYHAHFTSQVLVRDECLKPTEIVAWGRLGTGTKKAGLICCWDDGKGEIEGEAADMGEVDFYSLEWANFG